MSVHKEDYDEKYVTVRPRPGHADLAGVLKYARHDTRDILERASARETAARTAAGAVCRSFLSLFDIHLYSWVVQIGSVKAAHQKGSFKQLGEKAVESPVLCPDPVATKKMMEAIQDVKKAGDTLGGVYVVVVEGLPVGLGSYIQWDRKLDGQLAQALMSIQAHKGVEIGHGFAIAGKKGSEVHGEIFYSKKKGFYRTSNNAGGLEGGMSNGDPLILRAAVKPLASLRKPLHSVHLKSKDAMRAEIVRSDTAPVASAAVVGEAVTAITLTQVFLEKFGGDSLRETQANFKRYATYLKSY